MDVTIREIRPTARRHKISDARIRAAVKACPRPLFVDDPLTPGGELILFLAPDDHGNPLELVGREHADGSVTIFHAMPLREEYLETYERLTGFR